MTSTEPFVLSPEHQSLVLSALNAYAFEKKTLNGRNQIYQDLIARTEGLYDSLFHHLYGVKFQRRS